MECVVLLATAVIAKKRDGHKLTNAEIGFIVDGITNASLPDYQIAAWAMAVLCRGMDSEETACLTDCMLNSGGRLAPATGRPRVDKHSTGGLGDKVSLILAPLLACFDVDVPMLSGRGLGITGGTLDKLEAIPGFRADLSEVEIASQIDAIGCVITGTTDAIAPADRRLYLLRDATATVPSIPLITGSIMSKKLAASLDALVLDVKFGSGAFMRDVDAARQLAASLVATGTRMGVPTRALLSDMNQPLGEMVGNACEVNESVAVLQGMGPSDVRHLTIELCGRLLVQVGVMSDIDAAAVALGRRLDDGSALERFEKMVAMQGGEFAHALPLALRFEVLSQQTGWLASVNGDAVGNAVIQLGGGRRRLGDEIDPAVGLRMLAKVGDRIETGQALCHVFARKREDFELVRQQVLDGLAIKPNSVDSLPLILPL